MAEVRFRLENGDPAPEIELLDTDGQPWKLSDYRGKMVILHFCRGVYCHTTRGEFALWSTFNHIFQAMNAELVFVVRGGREQHREYRETWSIRPRILIDEEGKVGEDYGIYRPNSHEIEAYPNYKASALYLIDSKGAVSQFWLLSGPRGRPDPECLLGILALAKENDWTY
ncbi:MAG TPA: peroxiredoxin family protein [Armatimonadota bacterium]|jgi:peroxiredoxin